MILTVGIAFLISTFTVSVSGQVVFTTLPSNQNVTQSEDATFECEVNDGGTPLDVIWRLRKGADVLLETAGNASLNGSGGVTLGPNNGSPLTVTSVQGSLSGITVSCVGRINFVTRMEQTDPPANLSVTFPPEYSIDPSQSTAAVEGANESTYRFMLTANPIPAVFTWMKDGVELSSTSRIGLTVNSITIRDVLRSDAGLYTVSTGASATANFTLAVQFPPEYSIDLSQSTAVVEGANEYTYRFMLAAYPIPAVFTWMKDSAELSSTSRIGLTVDSITIRDVLGSDAGLYTVSTGASATANFTLDVMYPVRVLCGTVCAVVTPVVLVVAVLCCVAVPGTILCYCCLCKKRPGDMRTKPERLSDKEEKEVELT